MPDTDGFNDSKTPSIIFYEEEEEFGEKTNFNNTMLLGGEFGQCVDERDLIIEQLRMQLEDFQSSETNPVHIKGT
jgi:hypothetical protein